MQRGPKKPTLCETCENSVGRCSWSSRFEPVEGWEAIPTKVAVDKRYEQSYCVLSCPEYEKSFRPEPYRHYVFSRGDKMWHFYSEKSASKFVGQPIGRINRAFLKNYKCAGYSVNIINE